MLTFIEHLTSENNVIGIWSYNITPYDIQMFYTVNKFIVNLLIDY